MTQLSARRHPGASWTVLFEVGRKNLAGDPLRTAIALVGVTFATVLMLLQSAIYLGFIHSASVVIDHCDADLWLSKAGTVNFETAEPFEEDSIVYARALSGVEWAENIIYSFGNLRLPTGTSRWCHVVGFNPRTGVGGPWRMAKGTIGSLSKPGTFIIDQSALAQFEGAGIGTKIENFGHKAEIVGMSIDSRTCTPNPVVYTSLKTAQEQIPQYGGKTSFIVIKLKEGADVNAITERLRRLDQFQVLSKEDFSGLTQHYWATKTGIGIGIGVTIILGFIVGVVILGQTMYSATTAKLDEFATLKILGATNMKVCAILWYQAVLIAVVGFGLGLVLGSIIKMGFNNQMITLYFSGPLFCAIAVATLVMCLSASMLSVQRILKVSPASVFRV